MFFPLSACNAKIDLAILIDGSSSVERYGVGNFRRIIDFVRGLTMGFAISRTNTRVSLTVYGTRPRMIFNFRRLVPRKTVVNKIIGITDSSFGRTKSDFTQKICLFQAFGILGRRRGAASGKNGGEREPRLSEEPLSFYSLAVFRAAPQQTKRPEQGTQKASSFSSFSPELPVPFSCRGLCRRNRWFWVQMI